MGAFFAEILLIALLIGAAVGASYYLLPRAADDRPPAIGAVLFATLSPLATIVILSIVERLFPAAGPRKSMMRWLLHFRINIFLIELLALCAAWTIEGWTALARALHITPGLFHIGFGDGASILKAVLAVWLSSILTDFFFYWFHRVLHEVPFFWQHHKMHHMDTELEAVTVVRQNWIEAILSAIAITLPVAILFKFDQYDLTTLSLTSGIVTTVFVTMLTAGHMNIRVGAGPLSIVWCTPQMHRVHHSMEPQHFDKNYAFTFPVWDILFGTYFHPARDEYPSTGVKDEVEFGSFYESQIFTQREWRKFYRNWRAARSGRQAR